MFNAIEILEGMRKRAFNSWEHYHERVCDGDRWLDGIRDAFEVEVRTLDFIMEEIRRNDII